MQVTLWRRDGAFEFFRSIGSYGSPETFQIGSGQLELLLVKCVEHAIRTYERLGISGPLGLCFNIVSSYAVEFGLPPNLLMGIDRSIPLRRETHFPALILSSLPDEPATALRPLFDQIWQTFGYSRSFNFDDLGE